MGRVSFELRDLQQPSEAGGCLWTKDDRKEDRKDMEERNSGFLDSVLEMTILARVH